MENKTQEYVTDVLQVLKKTVSKMPNTCPAVYDWEFEMQIRLAEAQILKLKAEVGIK